MSGPTKNLTRKILFSAYRRSGKWYTSGSAYIEPNNPYWNNDELLRDIDSTNDQLFKGAISNKEYYITISELPDEVGQPFVARLII